MLTILAALNDELKLIKAEMELDETIHIKPFAISIGEYHGKKVCLVRTGVGKTGMQKTISYLIQTLKPSLLMNIGYAGGLDPQLHPGDLVIAKSVIEESTEASWRSDEELIKRAKEVLEAALIRHHVGSLLTVEKPLIDPHQKAFAGARFNAVACDMESSVLAEAASKEKIPFLVVRSILDSLDTPLPPIPGEAVFGGKIRLGPLLKFLKSNPKEIFRLPKFSYLCNQARISITNFVKEWIKSEKAI